MCLAVGDIEFDHRRAAVDDAAKGRAVALPKGGDAEKVTEGIVRHAELSGVS